MHVGMWGAIVTVAFFFAKQWTDSRDWTYAWFGGLAVQAFLHIWVTLIEEQYLATSYIENTLRRAIIKAAPGLKAGDFWQYEDTVARRRIPDSWWGEWLLPVILGVAFALALVWRYDALPKDLSLVIANAASIVAFVVRTKWRISLRRSFMKQYA